MKLNYLLVRTVRLWRKEARKNMLAKRNYENQKSKLSCAAFEHGLALAKRQCADQLEAIAKRLTK